MKTVEIILSLPVRGDLAKQAIESAVETLARADLCYLVENPDTPTLARSGVIYQRETQDGPERWQTIPEMLASGVGDCEDFAAWLIAQLRRRGVKAAPVAMPIIDQPGKWHILVRAKLKGNHWALTDPSKEAGM